MGKAIRYKAMVLLVAELFFIITSAFWDDMLSGAHFMVALYFIFFCLGGYSLTRDKKWLARYGMYCLVALVCSWFQTGFWIHLLGTLSTLAVYYMIFKAAVWYSLFRSKVNQADQILAGVAGYLLLGLFWTTAFMFLNKQVDGALLNQVSGKAATAADSLYFGFVTISTLGYGDIVPVAPIAKITAVLASVTGVLYIAILISAIVGGVKLESKDDVHVTK